MESWEPQATQKKVPSPGVAPVVYWLSSGALLMVSKIGNLP